MGRCIWVAAVVLVLGLGQARAGENGGALTLKQAVALALKRDALVRGAEHAVSEARAALAQAGAYTPTLTTSVVSSAARSAGLDPESTISGTEYSSQSYSSILSLPARDGTQLGLEVFASTSTTNSALRTGEDVEFTYATGSVGASLSRPLPLFRDERVLTRGQRWSAELTLRSSVLALEEARRSVAGDALSYFFGALRAQRRAEIAAASKREADELLRIAEVKLERGKLAEIEVMEARVSADTAAVALRREQSAAETARDRLKDFLGLPLDEDLRLRHDSSIEESPPSFDEGALVERAFVQRADLQQLALRVRTAELTVRRAEAQSRPGVFLTGSYSRSGEAETIGESFDDLVNPNWYVGITATTSLSRTEDRAEIARARSTLRLAELEAELRRDAVRLEVRRLSREADDAAADARVLAETVRIAEENLAVRRVQFEHGLVRSLDVAQTERQLSEARAQHLNAAIDQELAAARLQLAIGEMPFVERWGRPPGQGSEEVAVR